VEISCWSQPCQIIELGSSRGPDSQARLKLKVTGKEAIEGQDHHCNRLGFGPNSILQLTGNDPASTEM
jgi:hypothetical protein